MVALFTAVLPGSPTAEVDQLDEPEAFLTDPSSFVLGAYIDDTPIGMAWGLQMRSPSGRLTTYVHELDVQERWRRRGVGTALIAEAMTIARRRGSTKFWLSTGGHNETAQALYESLGGDRKAHGDVNYWWDLDWARPRRLPPIAGSAHESEEHEDRSTQPDEFFVAEPADALAELGAGHGCDLVDHETAGLSEPVRVVWIDPNSKQWGIGGIGRERADRHRVRSIKAIVLHDRHGSRLAHVPSAGSRGPDLAASQSSSRLTASMNA